MFLPGTHRCRGEEAGRHQLPARRHEGEGRDGGRSACSTARSRSTRSSSTTSRCRSSSGSARRTRAGRSPSTCLEHERTNIANVGINKRELARLKALARECRRNGRSLAEDPLFAARLAEVEIELMRSTC